ncbi:hypothetical protein K488DRAFT_89578 [Vararia minispora EC-137]|uniref:Uncharacterized protein n=1 Tax=Vararia minispora EC-137 TaxID=1314806 RepID=A0ACB8QA72_9AGAM|nr:hypothetical protein K488DRAFT_89578 [Vararia minispora EC-137]
MDLLLVAHGVQNPNATCFSPRSLASGHIHPLAQKSTFVLGVDARLLWFETDGRYILCRWLVLSFPGLSSFAVYDWTSGEHVFEIVAEYGSHEPSPFFFDEHHLMIVRCIPSQGDRPPELVCFLHPLGLCTGGRNGPALAFHFPPFSSAVSITDIRARSDGTGGGCFGDDAYFQEDATNRMLSFYFSLHSTDSSDPRRLQVLALASTFKKHFHKLAYTLPGKTTHIPFQEWAAHSVRIVSMPLSSSSHLPAYIPTLTSNDAIEFADYHPRRVAWAQQSNDRPSAEFVDQYEVVTRSQIVEGSLLADGKPLETSLPYIRTRSQPLAQLSLLPEEQEDISIRLILGRVVVTQYYDAEGRQYCNAVIF